jgi:hypothetical protein
MTAAAAVTAGCSVQSHVRTWTTRHRPAHNRAVADDPHWDEESPRGTDAPRNWPQGRRAAGATQ